MCPFALPLGLHSGRIRPRGRKLEVVYDKFV